MPSILFLLMQIHWDRVTHICVNNLDHHWFRKWLLAFLSIKPLSEPILIENCTPGGGEHISEAFVSKYINFHKRKQIWKCRLQNSGHLIREMGCSVWVKYVFPLLLLCCLRHRVMTGRAIARHDYAMNIMNKDWRTMVCCNINIIYIV